MEKRGIVISILSMILFVNLVSAYSVSPAIPDPISLKCAESYNQEFIITPGSGETITLTPMVISDDNMQMAITFNPSTNHFYLSLFQTSSCITGQKDFSFKINNDVKNIHVNVTADLFDLGSVTVTQGRSIDVGGKIDFAVLTTGDDKIRYSLECSTIEEGFLNIGESIDKICNGETFRFELKDSFSDLSAAILEVYSSESGYAITKSDVNINSDDCILGIDTLGAKVKRGNIFAIKTINSNTNKYVSGVSVTVLDQTGDESPINGISSNIGFFSERLYENYEQDLVVQLEKEGCEPYTNVILFENSYSDFQKDKAEQEQQTTLQITIDPNFIIGNEVTGTVKNLLGEAVDKVRVKITKPEETTFEVLTTESGLFKFTPEVQGSWKLQASKDNFISSELYEIEAISGEYTIIALVDGDEKTSFDKGDMITFELRDQNETVVLLDVEASYGNDKVSFVQGVSDEVEFQTDYKLDIPEVNGYESQDFKTRKVEGKFSSTVYWVMGIAAFIIVIVLISKLRKNSTPKINKMEVQLGGS